MAIDRCFKCDGEGTVVVPDVDLGVIRPGWIMRYRTATCPRCLGSGALDYRVVEAKPVEAKPAQNNPTPPLKR